MAGNTFGTLFRLTTFGESHGVAVGGIVDGCPAGLTIDFNRIIAEMDRRRPGQSELTTARNEPDQVEFLSGLMDGVTLGTPIVFILPNKDQRPEDYAAVKDAYRPSHADYTYQEKYGIRDARGGGRASARETTSRVAAGALARQLLETFNIKVAAYVSQVGEIIMDKPARYYTTEEVDRHPVRCPEEKEANRMQHYITTLRELGDSCGGVITCVVKGVPAGWGEPVFDKLSASLASACMSINAAHGFEFGSGFQGAFMKGSEHNDSFIRTAHGVSTSTNHSGGIQGGITNGMEIYFKVAFKPVATIMQPATTLNTQGDSVVLEPNGRHDPCVVPRAVPIVEAMTLLVLADMMLRNLSSRVSTLKKLI
jgi:chorismate synthase